MIGNLRVDFKRCAPFMACAAILFVAGGLFNLWFTRDYIYPWTSKPGALTLFLAAVDFSPRNALSYLALLVACFPGTYVLAGEMRRGETYIYTMRVGGFMRFSILRLVSAVLINVLTLLLSCALLWLICAALSPHPGVRVLDMIDTDYNRKVYLASMPLYAISAVGNMLLFGMALTPLTLAVGSLSRVVFALLMALSLAYEILYSELFRLLPNLRFLPRSLFILSRSPLQNKLMWYAALLAAGLMLYLFTVNRMYTGRRREPGGFAQSA